MYNLEDFEKDNETILRSMFESNISSRYDWEIYSYEDFVLNQYNQNEWTKTKEFSKRFLIKR